MDELDAMLNRWSRARYEGTPEDQLFAWEAIVSWVTAREKAAFDASRLTFLVPDSRESDADMISRNEWSSFEDYQSSLSRSRR